MFVRVLTTDIYCADKVIPCLMSVADGFNSLYLVHKPSGAMGGAIVLDEHQVLYKSPLYDEKKHIAERYWWLKEDEVEVVDDHNLSNKLFVASLDKDAPFSTQPSGEKE